MKDLEIFDFLAEKYRNSIEDTMAAEVFFDEFMSLTGGMVITDFINGDNYDRIEQIQFDHTLGLMTIHFRVPEKDPEIKEMRKMAFAGDWISMTVKLDTIRFICNNKGKAFAIAIRGVTDHKKVIRKAIKGSLNEKQYTSFNEEFYSTHHLKFDNGELSDIVGIDTPIVACWIIPKNLNISYRDSQKYLYRYNLMMLESRLGSTLNDLHKHWQATVGRENRMPLLQSAGNALRNIGETLLKLQCTYYFDRNPRKDKPYQNHAWGDSMGQLNSCGIFSKADLDDHTKFITKVNELSHASGIPADIKDVEDCGVLLKKFLDEFKAITEKIGQPEPPKQPLLPSPAKFIEDNFLNWDFSAEIQSIVKATSGKCVFKVKKEKRFIDITSFMLDRGTYLAADGRFREIDITDPDCLSVYSRDELIELINAIYASVKTKCAAAGYDTESLWIHLNITHKLRKSGIPSHLFTLDEIRDLMKTADDSQMNQLVIDEDGYPHLNHTPGMGSLYPVSQESWYAHNYYVGQSSALTDAEPSYHLSLQSWLRYLTTGHPQYSDMYVHLRDVDATIAEIKVLSASSEKS